LGSFDVVSREIEVCHRIHDKSNVLRVSIAADLKQSQKICSYDANLTTSS
jgi:hypothetical protein